MIDTKYKFGILYCHPDQTNEDQWYNNTETDPIFEDFLTFLGERVTLLGWPKFRGGLNITNNSTGTHSIYTAYQQNEIMFHVSTLLPFYPDDLQQVERKRHLGNDVGIIIWRHQNCKGEFTPLEIRSQFNHCFMVIQPVVDNNVIKYRIHLASKIGVSPYGPSMPGNGVYEKSTKLREFILCKLINGERSAMYAPDFKGKIISTRKQTLRELLKKFGYLK